MVPMESDQRAAQPALGLAVLPLEVVVVHLQLLPVTEVRAVQVPEETAALVAISAVVVVPEDMVEMVE